MKYTIEKVSEVLTENGIEHEIKVVNGFSFINVHNDDYGHPKGRKKRRNDFRPYFRISVHDDDPEGYVYVKDGGFTTYMTLKKIISKFTS